jgi:hypothetical protein
MSSNYHYFQHGLEPGAARRGQRITVAVTVLAALISLVGSYVLLGKSQSGFSQFFYPEHSGDKLPPPAKPQDASIQVALDSLSYAGLQPAVLPVHKMQLPKQKAIPTTKVKPKAKINHKAQTSRLKRPLKNPQPRPSSAKKAS